MIRSILRVSSLWVMILYQTSFGFESTGKPLLEFPDKPFKVINASGIQVPLYKTATAHPVEQGATDIPLYYTGAGILVKQVMFMSFNVYVLASYTDLPSGISPSNPLASLKEAKAKVVSMTLLRSVGPDEIQSAVEDCLSLNDVDIYSPGMRKLISEIQFSVAPGDKVTFLGRSLSGTEESIAVQTSLGHQIYSSEKDLSFNFWKIWFGAPLDQGYANLKKGLLNPTRYFLVAQPTESKSTSLQ